MAAQHEYPRVIPNTAAAQLKAAVRAERAAVVTWLRKLEAAADLLFRTTTRADWRDTAQKRAIMLRETAAAIERGDHVETP